LNNANDTFDRTKVYKSAAFD